MHKGSFHLGVSIVRRLGSAVIRVPTKGLRQERTVRRWIS